MLLHILVFKWCKIKPSDLLKSWDPELELNTRYFQMLEFLILKTESNNLDLFLLKTNELFLDTH
jgi:hypothetical protein